MPRLKKILRKIGVSIIGVPLLIIGIILIPAPGPGLLICLLAFGILSLEFVWAEGHFTRAKQQLTEIYKAAKARADKIENLDKRKKDKTKRSS